MKLVWCSIVLVAACHKHAGGGATPGSAGSAAVTGSDTAGSATTGSAAAGSVGAGSASAGSATAPASAQHLAAVDELDRWIAPIYKLDVPARYKALCGSTKPIGEKVAALSALGPPAGGDPQAWSDATDGLKAEVDGVHMCCKDLADYEKAGSSAKEAADWNHEDCMKQLPDAFAAVVKLVPGAKPPGTHAADPVMKP